MTRVEMLRAARDVVQVAFAEYLKLRSKGFPVLVFEGRQCPTYYISKIRSVSGSKPMSQLIARSKRNVLQLRELIQRNIATAKDLVLYFVDKDFDPDPRPGSLNDVYVTRGYSIENEVVPWPGIEGFIRSNFDIADADDEAALDNIQALYNSGLNQYFDATRQLQHAVYACRRNGIRCLPGESAQAFISIDWSKPEVGSKISSGDVLLQLLSVESQSVPSVLKMIQDDSTFSSLDPTMDWRGKYHLYFVRQFLIHVAEIRTKGVAPFKRAARVGVDPVHQGLMGAIASVIPPPDCLRQFVQRNLLGPLVAPATTT